MHYAEIACAWLTQNVVVCMYAKYLNVVWKKFAVGYFCMKFVCGEIFSSLLS